jgi:acid stress-induced BolA-like protein IbaG/YrbA
MTFSTNLSDTIKQRIESALPNSEAEVRLVSDRHYEISVVSALFKNQPQVKQHQQIYATITDLMHGDSAPIHAIDRMETLVVKQ